MNFILVDGAKAAAVPVALRADTAVLPTNRPVAEKAALAYRRSRDSGSRDAAAALEIGASSDRQQAAAG